MLTNFEVGADLLLLRRVRPGISVFHSIGSDFMYYVSTGDSVNMGYRKTPVFMKQNISRVHITGVEVDVDAEVTAWLSLFANYTFNHSVISKFTASDTAVDKDLSGKYLTDVPMHKASAGFTIKTRIISGNVVWKYTGKRYINDVNEMDPYLLSDQYPSFQTYGLKVWHTFFRRLNVSASIDNIFDALFIDDRLQQSPGRMITAECTFTF